MIRVDNQAGTTVIACNTCGGECEPSRVHDTDKNDRIEWAGITAMLHAESAGWRTYYVGRLRRTICPRCDK